MKYVALVYELENYPYHVSPLDPSFADKAFITVSADGETTSEALKGLANSLLEVGEYNVYGT